MGKTEEEMADVFANIRARREARGTKGTIPIEIAVIDKEKTIREKKIVKIAKIMPVRKEYAGEIKYGWKIRRELIDEINKKINDRIVIERKIDRYENEKVFVKEKKIKYRLIMKLADRDLWRRGMGMNNKQVIPTEDGYRALIIAGNHIIKTIILEEWKVSTSTAARFIGIGRKSIYGLLEEKRLLCYSEKSKNRKDENAIDLRSVLCYDARRRMSRNPVFLTNEQLEEKIIIDQIEKIFECGTTRRKITFESLAPKMKLIEMEIETEPEEKNDGN
jgi:hypothetical protein